MSIGYAGDTWFNQGNNKDREVDKTTDKDKKISSEELNKVTGGTGKAEMPANFRPNQTCPICQCPELTWHGVKYTCNECGYQGYAL